MNQRKPLNKQPPKVTARQKRAVAELAKGSSVAKAMRDAGYSERTARVPGKLTKTEGFRYLMEQMGLTDEKLLTVLDEGLGATRAVVMGTKSEESFVDIQPDYQVRHKYLETGLKLKGLTKQESGDLNFNFYAQKQRDDYELS